MEHFKKICDALQERRRRLRRASCTRCSTHSSRWCGVGTYTCVRASSSPVSPSRVSSWQCSHWTASLWVSQFIGNIITARIRRMREGTVFTDVCLLTFGGGATPSLQLGRMEGTPSFLMGTPFPGLDGGVLHPRSGQGVPQPRGTPCQQDGVPPPDLGKGYPLQTWEGGTLPVQTWEGVPSLSRPGKGVPPSRSGPRTGGGQDRGVPPTGTAQHVLATQRVVCLLRSRRRISLLVWNRKQGCANLRTFLKKTLRLDGSWRSCYHCKGELSRNSTINRCKQISCFPPKLDRIFQLN